MPSDLSGPPIFDPQKLPEAVFRSYTALTSVLPLDNEAGLGGKLLYAGELGGEGLNLLFAANIAGAASLAASADPTVQRQAIRDGVVDFLVTSLEEALRILKNEIRKRQTVSVAVGIAPQALVEQMLDRGVLPDLLFTAAEMNKKPQDKPRWVEDFVRQGALPITSGNPKAGADAYARWSVDRDFARWLPRLDAVAEESLPTDDWVRQRWLQLAPRYLGRHAQREHGVGLAGDELIRLRSMVLQLLTEHSQDAVGLPVVRINGVPVG
jgi:Urocanase Rossmann-like domain